MKTAAKWIAILWSIFCLFGVFSGMANVGHQLNQSGSELERGAAGIGIGCGLGVWLVAWAVIAGPALIIWTVTEKKEAARELSQISKQPNLCRHCGKYYEGEVQYCPNCGSPTKLS